MSVARAFAILVLCAGCQKLANPNPTTGPSYSTVPCADNCGTDQACLSKCQPASNNPPPSGLMPGK